jgi:hypothetical protein
MNRQLFSKQFNQRELPKSRARTLIGYIPKSTRNQDIRKADFEKKAVKIDAKCSRQFLRLLTTLEKQFCIAVAIPR